MKQNILFFCPREVNATMGGIERVTDTLARFLINAGYNVVFMSVEHTCEGNYDCVAPQYFTQKSGNKKWILEIIKKHEISVVINQMSFFSYCPKSVLPVGVKVITVMHDSYYDMYIRLQLNILRKWNWKRVVSKAMKQIYNESDRIVVFVPAFMDEYRFFCKYAKDEKFVVIPNFNSFDNPNKVLKKKKIIWIGRFAEWHKRTTDILKIWSKLENHFPEWSLDILGDGPDKKNIYKLYENLNLNRCIFRGIQNPRPYYEEAAIICMTSAFESFGMVLTEGMQHGCVPVAYDSYTAVRNIIHDELDGILVTPFHLDEYTSKLARLMENGDDRMRMSAAAMESVKRFNSENIIPKWVDLIESLKK